MSRRRSSTSATTGRVYAILDSIGDYQAREKLLLWTRDHFLGCPCESCQLVRR